MSWHTAPNWPWADRGGYDMVTYDMLLAPGEEAHVPPTHRLGIPGTHSSCSRSCSGGRSASLVNTCPSSPTHGTLHGGACWSRNASHLPLLHWQLKRPPALDGLQLKERITAKPFLAQQCTSEERHQIFVD
jgi:hypothetical protein